MDYANLTHCLLVSSAHNLCKQIGPRSGQTNVRPARDPICLTLRFLKEFFEKVKFEKKIADDKIASQEAKSQDE